MYFRIVNRFLYNLQLADLDHKYVFGGRPKLYLNDTWSVVVKSQILAGNRGRAGNFQKWAERTIASI